MEAFLIEGLRWCRKNLQKKGNRASGEGVPPAPRFPPLPSQNF
jgi:hypothetical protein